MKGLFLFISGIIVGMLIAPDKGSSTRKRITNLIDRFSNEDNDYNSPDMAEPTTFPSGEEKKAARENEPW
jgi:hypothetical protein